VNSVLEPPADRDMPAGRSTQMRAELLAAVRRPVVRDRPHRRRLVLAVAAAVAAAGVSVPVLIARQQSGVRVLAMSTAEMSPALRDAMAQCVAWNAGWKLSDLAMAAQRGRKAVGVFITPVGYHECSVEMPGWGGEPSGVMSGDDWRSREWMPGTTQVLGLSSSESFSGDVTAAGRISDRVHRVVLDDGNGRVTEARVERGLFAVISDGRVESDAALIAYGRAGDEISRERLFPPLPGPQVPEEPEQCYIDPSGRVVYGDRGPDCRPAERWSH
jgi:hypothetical protein